MFFDFDSEVAIQPEPETFETMSLEDRIAYAEWNLKVAQSHLDELLAEQDEIDAWADANAPEDTVLDRPSEWEVRNA